MASRGGGGGGGSGGSLRGWAESNARLLLVSVVGFGSGLLALVLAHRRGLLEGGCVDCLCVCGDWDGAQPHMHRPARRLVRLI